MTPKITSLAAAVRAYNKSPKDLDVLAELRRHMSGRRCLMPGEGPPDPAESQKCHDWLLDAQMTEAISGRYAKARTFEQLTASRRKIEVCPVTGVILDEDGVTQDREGVPMGQIPLERRAWIVFALAISRIPYPGDRWVLVNELSGPAVSGRWTTIAQEYNSLKAGQKESYETRLYKQQEAPTVPRPFEVTPAQQLCASCGKPGPAGHDFRHAFVAPGSEPAKPMELEHGPREAVEAKLSPAKAGPPLVVILGHSDDRAAIEKLAAIHLYLPVKHQIMRVWHPFLIRPGEDSGDATRAKVAEATFFVHLITAEYQAGGGDPIPGRRNVPVVLRPCDTTAWGGSNLPRGGKAISQLSDQAGAWVDIAQEITKYAKAAGAPA